MTVIGYGGSVHLDGRGWGGEGGEGRIPGFCVG